MHDLEAHCKSVIAAGSKSFSMASRLFSPEKRNAAVFLYSWCRYCDDEIDQASAGGESRLNMLMQSTRKTFSSEWSQTHEFAFRAFHEVVTQYKIPQQYPLDLLEGMAMDVRGTHYKTFEDLLTYCYRVAGTVGLMMSHIMGVSDENALRNAVDLGNAMQLTNIARDVMEDAALGRVYLPSDWLEEIGLTLDNVAAPENREKIAIVVERLLDRAELYYESGDRGLPYLSFRAACAVAAAREIYSEIGKIIRSRGRLAWNQRAYVPSWKKVFLVLRAFRKVFQTIPTRLTSPWSPVAITTTWRNT